MTRDKEPLYWMTNKEWYRINREKDCFELTDKAPERAQKSFELYNAPDKGKSIIEKEYQRICDKLGFKPAWYNAPQPENLLLQLTADEMDFLYRHGYL